MEIPNLKAIRDWCIGKFQAKGDYAEKSELDTTYQQATAYTDTKIADAMSDNQDVVEALQTAIGSKADEQEFASHAANETIHIEATERTNWNDANSKKHTHENKSVLDTITSALITAWNNAVSHISDTNMHVTEDEKALWNKASDKVDKEGSVTGVKGNAETSYRTGEVNITPENIGALPVDGTAKKATADANGNVIPDTYATKTELSSYQPSNVIVTKLTNEDLNTLKTGGRQYYSGGTNTCTNKPGGVDAFALNVYQSAGGWYTQELFASNNKEVVYIRYYNSSAWTAWKQLAYINSNVASATKATQDANGNNIADTYATKEELELYDKTITTGAVANGETVTIYSVTTQLQRKLLAIHFRGISNIVSTVFYYNGNLYDGVDFTTPKTSIAYAQVTISVESAGGKTYVKITNGMTSGSATYAMRKIVDL